MRRKCYGYVVDDLNGRRMCSREAQRGSSYCKRHLTRLKREIPHAQLKCLIHKYTKGQKPGRFKHGKWY